MHVVRWVRDSKKTTGTGNSTCNRNFTNAPRGWEAMPYIMGNELSEKIATFGLTWSMSLYLTLHYHMTKAGTSLCMAIVMGITSLTPLVGGFVADAYCGRFHMIFVSSISTLLGMLCLCLTASETALMPAPCKGKVCPPATKNQLGFLYTAFAFIAIGAGGLRSCLYPFGADQFGQSTIEEKKQQQSFFNMYYVATNIGMLLAATVITYIQLDVSWAWGFGVPTILMAASIAIFLAGAPKYRYIAPKGSQFTALAQVMVAAYRKRRVSLPADASELYHGDIGKAGGQDCGVAEMVLVHTDQFRFLDKAAVKLEGEEGLPWRLCEVEKVESLKCLIRIAPIWAAGIIPATNLLFQSTFVPLQALVMDRHLAKSFQVPPSSLSVFPFLALIFWLPFYDRLLIPLARRFGGDPVRGISILRRIGIGYFLAALSLVAAAIFESHRRSSSSSHMSAFWLIPQLTLLGLAEAFNIIGQLEFFYDQMPPSMRSVAGALLSVGFGLGSFLGAIIQGFVQGISGAGGHQKWIDARNLGKGHLDYLYYVVAGLMGLNFVYFVWCARNYKFNEKRTWTDSDPRRADGDASSKLIDFKVSTDPGRKEDRNSDRGETQCDIKQHISAGHICMV